MSLYHRYRPSTFDEIVGAKMQEVVSELRPLLASSDPPHAYLLHGSSGCGKTTLGRILCRELGVVGDDYEEKDSADFRGIDTIRDIRRLSYHRPMYGKRRTYLLDECFAAGTLVAVPGDREVPIETVNPGDSVLSLAGPSPVANVFRNVVSLDRIVRLCLSNGRHVFTTVDHLFFTKEGRWKRTVDLCLGELLHPVQSGSVLGMDFVRGSNVADLPGMRRIVPAKEVGTGVLLSTVRMQSCPQSTSAAPANREVVPSMRPSVLRYPQGSGEGFLLDGLCESPCCNCAACRPSDRPMRDMWRSGRTLSEQESEQGDVWDGVREHIGRSAPCWTEALGGDTTEVSKCAGQILGHGAWSRNTTGGFGTYAGVQPVYATGGNREGEGYEAHQGYAQCVEGGAWWEREIDRAAEAACHGPRMAYGGSDPDRSQPAGRKWVSDVLQGGRGESRVKVGHRGGRSYPPIEERGGARREEGAETGDVRVESAEVYQRGRNDEYFGGIIGDRERDRGFAIFYDLQVERHPSYFAAGVAVHNCHKLTNEAQNALLKGLEDPPPHAYFVLCTTDPDKLLATIRGRCVQFQVHPLEEREMIRHLNSVAREEGESIPRDVLRAIADKSDGHSRDALQILEKVLAAPPERRAALVDDVATVKSATQRLARTLLEGTGWRRVADELTRIAAQEWRDDDDVKEKAKGKPRPVDDYDLEQIRRGVLAYSAKVLLGGENDTAADVISEFRQPFFESGMAGLVLACYGVVKV